MPDTKEMTVVTGMPALSTVLGVKPRDMINIKLGDCIEQLKLLENDSVDSLVTDPPAGISFMGKKWDDDKGGRAGWVFWMTEAMEQCLRVLKPGAHGLVWAIPRTSHWTMTALENAGFEVRDVVTHLFGTGFPKSLNVSKAIDKAAGAEREVLGVNTSALRPNRVDRGYVEGGSGYNPDNGATITAPSTDDAKRWQGWGTALKPACEFWVLVRKPCSEKTVAANVLKWGCGALNIDASRIETTDKLQKLHGSFSFSGSGGADTTGKKIVDAGLGRFPANLVLDEEAAAALDEQSGVSKSTGGTGAIKQKQGNAEMNASKNGANPVFNYGDSGGASRFFYVAKASRADKGADNSHPTVKSTALMSYLIKLVTPPGGTVLDPFMGSGSTGVAAHNAGFRFTGIEQDPEYFGIASKRLGVKEDERIQGISST